MRKLPAKAELERLKVDREVAKYMVDRGIPMPVCPPKHITPSPGLAPGARFDESRVDRVLSAFRAMRHTQGKWAGSPLKPDPWQIAYILGPIFGWVAPDSEGDWCRVVRQAFVDVPRRNGKTTICGGLAIYLLAADREPGAQIYAAATKKDQAAKLFDPVCQLAKSSPTLMRHLTTRQGKIIHPKSGGYFKVEANDADGLHGANVHAAVVDELHLHKSPDLLKALESGTGSRRQPLIFVITTADDGRTETVYAQRRSLVEQLANGVVEDPAYYGVVWGADEDDDPFDEATWRRANPGYGISPSSEFLKNQATLAKNSPADLAEFLRLHLGIRTKQVTRYITLEAWDQGKEPWSVEELEGRHCYCGLDLADTQDLCALCLAFPWGDGKLRMLWHLWTPEDNLKRLDKRTAGAASVWVRDGLLTVTPGNTADYGYIERTILDAMDRYDVRDIAYDSWHSSHLVTNLVEQDVPMSPMRQGFASMSPPLKEVQKLILEGKILHGGNAAIRWQVDGFPVAMDPAGNVKPDRKAAATTGFKIDGVVAMTMAMDLAMRHPQDDYYETHELLII